MATRRSFTFGSLVLALTGPSLARAEEPQRQAAVAPPRAQPEPPRLKIHLDARRKGQVLLADVRVENLQREPVDLVVRWGSRPGVHLDAAISVAGEPLGLAAVLEGDRREFMSRLGPVPEWAPLAGGKSLKMGPYKFGWPEGVPDGEVTFSGFVTCEGDGISFERRIVLGRDKATEPVQS